MATRRRTLGEAYVAGAETAKTAFDTRFQQLLTEAAWGRVWSDDHFTPRERSLVTLAILAARGHWEELALHVRATRNTGASPQDVAEVMMHVAIYAGIPAANHAMKVAKETLGEGERDEHGRADTAAD